jgi:hypothetical protein
MITLYMLVCQRPKCKSTELRAQLKFLKVPRWILKIRHAVSIFKRPHDTQLIKQRYATAHGVLRHYPVTPERHHPKTVTS